MRGTDGNAATVIRRTYSLCPVCLRKVPARLERRGADGVWLCKSCPDHGSFAAPVWRDRYSLERWTASEWAAADEGHDADACSGDCRSCGDHPQGTCCVILEVTGDCDLACPYCFARGGEDRKSPSFDELCAAVDDIVALAGDPLIQFSGGEPTLRDDLPDLIIYAKSAGCSYAQVNTNGIRLAQDEDYVRRLADAGLDIVFLQFDGVDDGTYRQLRGRGLLETKLRAIENCGRRRIGVTLVPTVVRGVNDKELGNIIRKAVELFPAVRSVHFQPVTYLGRYPGAPAVRKGDGERYTLDELMSDICEQTGIPETAMLPSRCDHAMCEFHATFMVNGSRQLVPLTDMDNDERRGCTPADVNRRYVAEHWKRGDENPAVADVPSEECCCGAVAGDKDAMDLDEFLDRVRTSRFKISAMAFQDAMNIDLGRLMRCSLHVYESGRLLPFCAKYLTPVHIPEE